MMPNSLVNNEDSPRKHLQLFYWEAEVEYYEQYLCCLCIWISNEAWTCWGAINWRIMIQNDMRNRTTLPCTNHLQSLSRRFHLLRLQLQLLLHVHSYRSKWRMVPSIRLRWSLVLETCHLRLVGIFWSEWIIWDLPGYRMNAWALARIKNAEQGSIIADDASWWHHWSWSHLYEIPLYVVPTSNARTILRRLPLYAGLEDEGDMINDDKAKVSGSIAAWHPSRCDRARLRITIGGFWVDCDLSSLTRTFDLETISSCTTR